MHKERLLAIIEAILDQPTAPFHEAAVRETIASLLGGNPRVQVRQDDFGNLIAHYRGPSPGDGAAPARYAFCAHMDHPGWVRTDATETDAPLVFLGGVPPEYQDANRERIRNFGAFSMWDLPSCETRDGLIHSRACDDLIGCAVIVATLEELDRTDAPVECYGLFTRAEEVGFAGAIEMARNGWLQERNLTVISLETSAERPPARMGEGAIVRVGDRTSIFDPGVTAELLASAVDAGLTVQRCLMSGGSCEATAFRLYGVRCGALCVALGNYHNLGDERRIEAEYVSRGDVAGLAALCVALARRSGAGMDDADAVLRAKLEERACSYAAYQRRDQPFLSTHE